MDSGTPPVDSGTDSMVLLPGQIFLGPGATDSDPALFEGPSDDPSRAPELVYPADGILVPPNLNELEFQFMPAGSDIFELEFIGAVVNVKVYFTCQTVGTGCGYTPDDMVWRALASAERGRDAVRYVLRGTSRSGGGIGAATEQTIEFAEEDITGGIYYWNAGAGAVRRYDFGLRGQMAENYMDAARAGATTCVGCHVVSRDGSKIAVGLDIPSPAPYKVYEVGTRTQIYQQGSMFDGMGSNFFSFSPDASRIMTSNGVSIVLRDANSGAAIVDPLVNPGAMPDWSPDGSRMVYARPGTTPPCFPGLPCGSPGVASASLQTMTFDGSMWSPGPELVPFSGANNYYPTYSPDGGWVLFNRSPANNDSFDAPDAELWAVPAAGGTPVRLDRASSSNGDSWPKFDPTIYMHRGRALMWITVASRRPYGLRLSAGEQAQLWMTAFDPSDMSDPARPMFWLPFQEIGSGNHIAQWVTSIDRQPCTDDTMCEGGEFCQDGICVPELI